MKKIILTTGFILCSFSVYGAPQIKLNETASQSEIAPKLSQERVIFHTNFGDVVVALYPEISPKHVAQILKMAKAGVYDGSVFFRVESGFVAQVENFDARRVPLTEEQRKTVMRLPAEFSNLKHIRGRLSMARFDDPNSAESSFSFMLGEAPHLDHNYTVFGEVVFGFNTLASIEQVSIDTKSYPREEIKILKAEVIENGNTSQSKLRERTPLVPNEENQRFFALFAAAMFLITAGTPVYKAAFSPRPTSSAPAPTPTKN